jgi:EAL and modified HD-GYP domain-containing signal transduction protein
MRAADIFVGRQPILDRRHNVVAYELLYREASDCRLAGVRDDAVATARLMDTAFRRLGIRTVLGPCRGFVNVDAETLMGRTIESLPRGQVVLELLETVVIDDQVVRRCRELKCRGFRLALDDFCRYDERYEPLLEIADIVKIDILELDRDALADLVGRLKLYPARLLAEKVENRETALRCLKLGFDLFQGFLYGRPAVVGA